MRSALGIQRIAGTKLSQVMQCTPSDIHKLQTHVRKWGMPNFSSYSLLLRALTHPSISNWAERAQSLPRHSLSPHTLELLGDRIVGVAAATALNAQSDASSWRRALPPLDAVLGNRGMALVADRIGLSQLLRWERATPPSLHRGRVGADGVDVHTGMLCNEYVNTLAGAYEAVAAAAYLDGGFDQASLFVRETLFKDIDAVRIANARTMDMAERLLDELVARGAGAMWLTAPDYEAGRAGGGTARINVDVVDLECEHDNPAHPLFYSAVVVRAAGVETVGEDRFLSFASHFSLECARMAAISQAICMLRMTSRSGAMEGASGTEVVMLKVRGKGESVSVGTVKGGLWKYDGDYVHLDKVLRECGLGVDVSNVGESREDSKQGLTNARYESVSMDDESGALIDIDCLQTCLAAGDKVESESALLKRYVGLNCSLPEARAIYGAIEGELRNVANAEVSMQRGLVRSLHYIGHQTFRLWSVQRSMKGVSENRVEIVKQVEEGMRLKSALERRMIGDGLGVVQDRRVCKLFVALGGCVRRYGVSAALAWLSGADVEL